MDDAKSQEKKTLREKLVSIGEEVVCAVGSLSYSCKMIRDMNSMCKCVLVNHIDESMAALELKKRELTNLRV